MKQTVHFSDLLKTPQIGERALVETVDHTSMMVQNGFKWVSTSPVEHITFSKSGEVLEFVTKNTNYIRE